MSLKSLNETTRDKALEGYEFTLTANPTRQWRAQGDFSITEGVEAGSHGRRPGAAGRGA